MRRFGFFLFALPFWVAHVRAFEPLTPVDAAYGIPATLSAGLLKYPQFTVRLKTRTEYVLENLSGSWVVEEIEVLKDGRFTIGGDVVFTSEQRANARRFDVDKHIFVAEMFATTADQAVHRGEHVVDERLRPDEIIVWDQTSAEQHNAALAPVWQRERILEGTRYSTLHAYENGDYIDGFCPEPGKRGDYSFALARHSHRLEPQKYLFDRTSVLGLPTRPAAFGVRINFPGAVLQYPGLSIAFTYSRENLHWPGAEQKLYVFDAYDSEEKKACSFRFDTSSHVNGALLTVAGVNYFAEMLFSTGNSVPGETGFIDLSDIEVIVWDLATAKAHNPIAARIIEHPAMAYGREINAYVGGQPAGTTFTGTYFLDQSLSGAELDGLPLLLSKLRLVLPKNYVGTSLVAHIHGYVEIDESGNVQSALATHGSADELQPAVQEALRQAKFTIPKKNGSPVKARLSFEWTIAEPIVADPRFY